MANNPLYPGYKPKKEDEGSINPIYPGYYTGSPVRRKPKSPEIPPMEYKFDEFINQIDNVAKEVSELPIHPKWVMDRVADDWKEQLKVTVRPKGGDIDPTDLDDYATDDLAGALTSLSLNPKDWGIGHEKGFEQTKKQAKKTLTSWIKEATGIDSSNLLNSNFSEIQNKATEELWTHALGYGQEKASEEGKAASKDIAERTTVLFSDVVDSESQLSPLDLRHKEEIDSSGRRIIEKDDIYTGTATAIAKFARGRDSPRNRDSLHTDFLSESVKAVKKEIEGSKEFERATPKQKAVVDFFNKKVDTLETIEEVNKTTKKAADDLQKQAFDIKDKWRVTGTKEDSIKRIVDDSLDKLNEQRGKLEKLIEKDNLNNLVSTGISSAEIEKFKTEIDRYTGRIKEIEDTLRGVKEQKINVRNAIKEIYNPSPDKNFVSRSTFKDSLGGDLRKDLEKSILNKGENDIGSFINAEGSTLRAKKIAPIMYRLQQDRVHYAAKEVLDAFDKGGISQVAENYAWKAIKNKLPGAWERYTSGSIVADGLKRTNYFGLKIDDRGIAPDEYFDIHPWKKARFEKRYVNKIDVNLDGELKGLGGLNGNKIRVTGSDVSEDKFKYLKDKYGTSIGTKPASLAIIGDSNFKKFKFNQSVEDQILMARLINNDRSEDVLDKLSNKLFGENKSYLDLSAGEREKINEFFTKIDYGNNWVYQKTGGKIKALEMKKGTINLNNDTLKDFLNNSGITGVNKDWLKVDKLTIDYGKHLDIFYNKKLGGFLEGAASLEDKEKVLKDILSKDGLERAKSWKETILLELFGKKEVSKEGFDDLSKQLNIFKQYLKTKRDVFGDVVDNDDFVVKMFLQFKEQKITKSFGAVGVDQNDKSFVLIKSIFDKNESMNKGYRLTEKRYMGRLEKINDKMQSLQKWFNKTAVGKLIKKFSIRQQKTAELVAKWLTKLLAKLTGAAVASTGVFAALAPIIQAIAEKIIKKGVEYAQKLVRAIFTLNFDDLNKLLDKDFKNIANLLMISCSCLVVLTLPAITVIYFVISIFNPLDDTRMYNDGYAVLPTSGEPDPRVFGCDGFGTGTCSGKGECSQNYGCGGHTTERVPGVGGFFYSQCDSQWGALPMASIPDDDGNIPTICSWGCALTSKAMIYKYFGYNWTPADLLAARDGITHINEYGYLVSFDLKIDDIHLTIVHNPPSGLESRSTAVAALKDFFSKYPAGVALVKTNKGGGFCFSQHWVVVPGPCSGNDFILYDPWRGPDAGLLTEYPTEPLSGIFGYYVGDGQCAAENIEDPIGDPLNCGKEADPDCVTRPAPSSSNRANRALEIACDLRPGFECLYNRPLFNTMPEMYSHSGNVKVYPGEGNPLFDLALFTSNPGAPENHGDYSQLFWCTWLPVKVYNSLVSIQHGAAGVYMGAGGKFDLGANTMCQQIARRELGFQSHYDPEPGDVACFDWDNNGVMDHVGIVYSVLRSHGNSPQGVNVVESNGGWVYNFYAKSGDKYDYIKFFGRQGGSGPLPE